MDLNSNQLVAIVIALKRFLHDSYDSVTAHSPSKQASSSLNQAELKMSSATLAAGGNENESGGAEDFGLWSLLI